MNKHPYASLPQRAFWKTAVNNVDAADITGLWDPKSPLSLTDKVVTYGSCFSQRIGRALAAKGYNWLCTEQGPADAGDLNHAYNYGIFSSRTGNIYTTSLLHQWMSWAVGHSTPPDEVWEQDGRFYDPFRPRIEPNGFASAQEVKTSRAVTIDAFRKSIEQADVFIFTLGLTERWRHQTGYEYPMCPGTVAGEFDGKAHVFDNMGYPDVLEGLRAAMVLMREVNPDLKFVLTVSPVPVTATNAGQHVIAATMYTKSVLRVVADALCSELDHVDYFPSYEVLASPAFKAEFYEANQREISTAGIDRVVREFISCLNVKFGGAGAATHVAKPTAQMPHAQKVNEDDVCEEELLNAFADKT
ncbi:MAG: GSCFA domain-containing protein [Sulfitobacter sp.]